MSLLLTQIQKNCQAINGYTFPNISVAQDGTLSGFSNLNIVAKGITVCSNWLTGENNYSSVQKVVMETLESIKPLFDRKRGKCPFFFYMDPLKSDPPTPISYRETATRVLNSNTFKSCEELKSKASEVIELYDGHPFGGDDLGLQGADLIAFKNRLVEEIYRELGHRYSSGSISPEILKLHESYGITTSHVPVPPEDAFDNQGMEKYLQEKVRTLKDTIIEEWDAEGFDS
jgi:hypothetical protein